MSDNPRRDESKIIMDEMLMHYSTIAREIGRIYPKRLHVVDATGFVFPREREIGRIYPKRLHYLEAVS